MFSTSESSTIWQPRWKKYSTCGSTKIDKNPTSRPFPNPFYHVEELGVLSSWDVFETVGDLMVGVASALQLNSSDWHHLGQFFLGQSCSQDIFQLQHFEELTST
jgi:hypothetical protein